MCWISRNIPKKSQAIRDIPVYKILTYDPKEEKYTSPVMDYQRIKRIKKEIIVRRFVKIVVTT